MHPDNEGVVVWHGGAPWNGGCREVPYSDGARELIVPWMDLRPVIAPGHDRAWLNLHARTTVREPMTDFTFGNLLGTSLGPGWTFRRLRDTAALRWVQDRVPVLEVVERLGLAVSSIDRILTLAPITTEELLEAAQRFGPEFELLAGEAHVAEAAARGVAAPPGRSQLDADAPVAPDAPVGPVLDVEPLAGYRPCPSPGPSCCV
jgi:hypothetical protein